jgi:hypothetical protein
MAPLGESGNVGTGWRDTIVAGIGAGSGLRHRRPHRGAHGSGGPQDGSEIGLPLPAAGQVRPCMAGVGSRRDAEAEGK